MADENFTENPIVLYTSPDGRVTAKAVVKDETLWMTQAAMAELFGVNTPAISKHLKNIFSEGELDEQVVVSKMETTTQHGAIEGKTQSHAVNYYNLDAIIAVGYRVNSLRATQFRIWATSVLREYIIKGFAMDDNRLKKGGNPFGKDYFRESNAGHVSRGAAEKKAGEEYDQFNRTQPIVSDFDREVKRLLGGEAPEQGGAR